jgi:hypothetical protein
MNCRRTELATFLFTDGAACGTFGGEILLNEVATYRVSA